jgi:hypothetical protein
LVFEATQEADGGYCAGCLTENIFTQADTWEELRKNVIEATSAFFFDQPASKQIRLHLVRDESCRLREDTARRFRYSPRRSVMSTLAVRGNSQTGSHIILETADPSRQRIAIPAYKALRIGTFSSILRRVSDHKGINRESIILGISG